MQSHRGDAPPWLTTDITEQGDRVRVTVRTNEPRDAQIVALRVINQRRGQAWRVIEVAVQDAQGEPVDVITSTWPHPARTLRDD